MNFKLLSPDAKPPFRATDSAAGYDLHTLHEVFLTRDHDFVVRIRTGVSVELPPGHVGLILARSGLSARGMHVLGGVVDSDYRGELIVLARTCADDIVVMPGDRIAQLVVMPIRTSAVEIVSDLPPTERGSKGFGSTGA